MLMDWRVSKTNKVNTKWKLKPWQFRVTTMRDSVALVTSSRLVNPNMY